MVSSLSWLDHDAAAGERSLRLLSFFRERESRDELGIGGIRDAIADQLFPGTSTIQTRLRYVFFIPWLLASLEERDRSSAELLGFAKKAEQDLLRALVTNVPATEKGVIGRDAGSELKRLPSSVYWACLESWGLRRSDVTLQQYFALAGKRRTLRASRRTRDDGDLHDGDASGQAWHPGLIKLRPEIFPDGAKLALTKPEAEFLLDRWTDAHPHSLLTWIALDTARSGVLETAERIWEHPSVTRFPAKIRDLLDDAHRLDTLVHGAALLYNLQLAQQDHRDELASQYEQELDTWSEQQLPLCRHWNLDEFWRRVVGKGHTISDATQQFVARWLRLATAGETKLSLSENARAHIKTRERTLKGSASRFENAAALTQWGGRAGLSPLTYRWPVASDFLNDWHAGWKCA